jgi:hypothetical protein
MEWLYVDTRTTPYNLAGNITLDQMSAGITVKNTGNSICIVNGDPLQPTESKGFAPPWNALLKGRYALKFQTPATVPPGYVQADSAVVTEMYYIPNPSKC